MTKSDRSEAAKPAVVVVGSDPQAVAETTGSIAEEPDLDLTVVDVAGAIRADRDVVVIVAGCVLGSDTLSGLQAAAYSETTVATATPLVLTERDLAALDQPTTFADAARRVRAGALGLLPRLRTCAGPCTYVRRTALELVGSQGLLPPGRDAFSRRCLRHGLVHVAADAVVVLGNGSAPGETAIAVGAEVPPRSQYAAQSHEPLARALSTARRSLRGLSVTIDARCLTEPMTGTQVHVLELVGALARDRRARVRVLLPEHVDPGAAALLERVAYDVERITLDADDAPLRTDIAHRPYQVSAPSDMDVLRRFGDRAVVTQQDMIGYGNATSFSSDAAWERHRALTRAALASADRVVFFSDYVAREAVAEGLVRSDDARVVHLGTDHFVTAGPDAVKPATLRRDEFMVCIGTDFVHKNRVFALAVCSELALRHEWSGSVVFAGSRIAAGSSADDEAAFVRAHPELEGRVVDLGRVSDGETRWLLENAQLVVYPSVVEGFGLIPFEAARAGTPCAFASQGALAETLPEGAALIVPWDAAASADRIAQVLADATVADELVETILRAGQELTWARAAQELSAIYDETASGPSRATDQVAFASSPSLAMVEPLMPPDVQQAFAAVLVRPRARAIVFRALLAARRVRRALTMSR